MLSHKQPVHRQLLTLAAVTSPLNHASNRWVDQQVFNLWQMYMQTRHGFTVAPIRSCVWMSQQECARHPALIERVKFKAPVQRLSFDTYQPDLGTSIIRNRFVADEDQRLVVDKLRAHFNAPAGLTELKVTEGMALWVNERPSLVSSDHYGSDEATPSGASAPEDYMADNCNMPRGLAPVRSEICS